MSVMMYFIYGGTLDFPEKANVGYVLFLIILNIKVLVFFWLLLCWAMFQSISEVEASLLLPVLPYLMCIWEYLKIMLLFLEEKNIAATHSNKIKKSLY